MTKLPPGFTQEVPQHIQLYPEPDVLTGVPVIDLDLFCCGTYGLQVMNQGIIVPLGAHGFSALIVCYFSITENLKLNAIRKLKSKANLPTQFCLTRGQTHAPSSIISHP